MASPKPVILDMDPGTDDALALMLALASEELEIVLVNTVCGNVRVEKAFVNASKILNFAGRVDVVVSKGASKPLVRNLRTAEHKHGTEGLGNARLPDPKVVNDYGKPAPQALAEVSESYGKGKLWLVCTGPLTNIALAFSLWPELVKRLEKMVIMGGAYFLTPYGYGNVTPLSEFNMWTDPEAAKIVLRSKVSRVLVGLDVTTDPSAVINREVFETISKAKGSWANLVKDIVSFYIDRGVNFALHDPMALAYVIDRSLFKTEKYPVDVLTYPPLARGMTVVDRASSKKAISEICTGVDGPRFIELFSNRVIYR